MTDRPGAQEWVPETRSLPQLRSAADDCCGCELWIDATQVVFSRGRRRAAMMLVGEQPGDVEDREGEPFVGPAGRVLDDVLARAGIERGDVYLTNAVKNFRHEVRGTRRIHQKPAVAHITACQPWLDAERGRAIEDESGVVVLTSHPSSVLRLRDRGERDTAIDQIADDLRVADRLSRDA